MANDSSYENAPLIAVAGDDEMPESAVTGLALLAERVEQLAQLCQWLTGENQRLQQQQAVFQAERDSLREQYEQARARIDAMVVRLKGLGDG